MLHAKMKKILEIFKKEVDENDEGYWFNNDKTFQMFDYMDFVSVTFDPPVKNKKDTPICFSFYSGCPPTFAAFLIRALYKHDVT